MSSADSSDRRCRRPPPPPPRGALPKNDGCRAADEDVDPYSADPVPFFPSFVKCCIVGDASLAEMVRPDSPYDEGMMGVLSTLGPAVDANGFPLTKVGDDGRLDSAERAAEGGTRPSALGRTESGVAARTAAAVAATVVTARKGRGGGVGGAITSVGSWGTLESTDRHCGPIDVDDCNRHERKKKGKEVGLAFAISERAGGEEDAEVATVISRVLPESIFGGKGSASTGSMPDLEGAKVVAINDVLVRGPKHAAELAERAEDEVRLTVELAPAGGGGERRRPGAGGTKEFEDSFVVAEDDDANSTADWSAADVVERAFPREEDVGGRTRPATGKASEVAAVADPRGRPASAGGASLPKDDADGTKAGGADVGERRTPSSKSASARKAPATFSAPAASDGGSRKETSSPGKAGNQKMGSMASRILKPKLRRRESPATKQRKALPAIVREFEREARHPLVIEEEEEGREPEEGKEEDEPKDEEGDGRADEAGPSGETKEDATRNGSGKKGKETKRGGGRSRMSLRRVLGRKRGDRGPRKDRAVDVVSADEILSDLHSLRSSSNECDGSLERQHGGEDAVPEEGSEDGRRGRDGPDEGAAAAVVEVAAESNEEEGSGARVSDGADAAPEGSEDRERREEGARARGEAVVAASEEVRDAVSEAGRSGGGSPSSGPTEADAPARRLAGGTGPGKEEEEESEGRGGGGATALSAAASFAAEGVAGGVPAGGRDESPAARPVVEGAGLDSPSERGAEKRGGGEEDDDDDAERTRAEGERDAVGVSDDDDEVRWSTEAVLAARTPPPAKKIGFLKRTMFKKKSKQKRAEDDDVDRVVVISYDAHEDEVAASEKNDAVEDGEKAGTKEQVDVPEGDESVEDREEVDLSVGDGDEAGNADLDKSQDGFFKRAMFKKKSKWPSAKTQPDSEEAIVPAEDEAALIQDDGGEERDIHHPDEGKVTKGDGILVEDADDADDVDPKNASFFKRAFKKKRRSTKKRRELEESDATIFEHRDGANEERAVVPDEAESAADRHEAGGEDETADRGEGGASKDERDDDGEGGGDPREIALDVTPTGDVEVRAWSRRDLVDLSPAPASPAASRSDVKPLGGGVDDAPLPCAGSKSDVTASLSLTPGSLTYDNSSIVADTPMGERWDASSATLFGAGGPPSPSDSIVASSGDDGGDDDDGGAKSPVEAAAGVRTEESFECRLQRARDASDGGKESINISMEVLDAGDFGTGRSRRGPKATPPVNRKLNFDAHPPRGPVDVATVYRERSGLGFWDESRGVDESLSFAEEIQSLARTKQDAFDILNQSAEEGPAERERGARREGGGRKKLGARVGRSLTRNLFPKKEARGGAGRPTDDGEVPGEEAREKTVDITVATADVSGEASVLL